MNTETTWERPTTIAAACDTFTAEFDAIESTLIHACSELAKLMTSHWLNVGSLNDAQNHALASVAALRNVARGLDPHARPRKRPQDCPLPLADQLSNHREALVQTLGLVQLMPGINRREVSHGTQSIAEAVSYFEAQARIHQPRKARQ